jgi:hypothetical protein
MRLRRLIILHGLALAVSLSCRAAALADSEVTISPAGSDAFSVKGNLLDKVTALEITVDYDAGTLSNPSASCGPLAGSAHCEINSATSGLVQIRIKSETPLSGFGVLASLSFTRQGDEPGTINSLDARLTGINGDLLPARVNVVNLTAGQSGRPMPKPLKAAAPDSTPQSPSPGGGAADSGTLASMAVKNTGRKLVEPAANVLQFHRLESVLERFRGRPDTAPLDTLLPLFEKVHGGEIRQDPPIILSDGRSMARLTVTLAGNGSRAPIFGLHGVRFISLQRGDGNGWIIDVLPDKGVYEASLTVLTDASLTEYPLTVAPPMEAAGRELGAADFEKSRGNRSRMKTDAAKGASRPGYVEDYIYAANYLARKPGSAHP